MRRSTVLSLPLQLVFPVNMNVKFYRRGQCWREGKEKLLNRVEDHS